MEPTQTIGGSEVTLSHSTFYKLLRSFFAFLATSLFRYLNGQSDTAMQSNVTHTLRKRSLYT